MKHLMNASVLVSLFLTACGTSSTPKGQVDIAKVQAGVPITLNGKLATFELPFLKPVPDVPDSQVNQVLQSVMVLVVKSPRTGTSVTFANTTFVPKGTMPSAANEFSWVLNATRDRATVTFFNETTTQLTLKPGVDYDALVDIPLNDLIETVPSTAFVVHTS